MELHPVEICFIMFIILFIVPNLFEFFRDVSFKDRRLTDEEWLEEQKKRR